MNPQILYNIFEKVNERKKEGKDIIKLNVGEPEQSPPKILFRAIKHSLKSGRIDYGQAAGDPKLRLLLAQKHKVLPENILIGPGAKFLTYAVLKLLTTDKKGVVTPLPSWSALPLMFKDLGIDKIRYLSTDEENGWQINLIRLKEILDSQTGILILINPNNPTGTLIDNKINKEINKIAKEKKITLIKDCTYETLIFGKTKIAPSDFLDTIEIHSFSKKFCLTGFRIGYLIAKKEIVKKLTNFMQITITSVPLFIQDGVAELIIKESSFSWKMAKVYEKRAQIAGQMLKKAGISFVDPKAGFYIFANIRKPSEKFCLDLISKGVAVVPGTAFGPYPKHIRISLTEREDRLIRGIKILISNLN